MADRYWLGTTNAVYSTAANWSATSGGAPGGVKPGAGDDVFFDGAGDNACTLDEATAAVNSWSVHSAGDPGGIYSATLDFNDQAVNVTGGGDMTFDGSGIVDCGASTITCGGNFDNKDQGTWTYGTSTLVMTGTTKTIITGSTKDIANLTIDGSTEVHSDTAGRLEVRGDLTVNNGKSLTCNDACFVAGDVSNNGGTIAGSNTLTVRGGNGLGNAATIINSGTWSVTNTELENSVVIGPGTYASNWSFSQYNGWDTDIQFGLNPSDTLTFTGAFTFDSKTDNKDLEIRNDIQDPVLIFQGNVTFATSGAAATLTWTKGTGTISCTGGNDQILTTLNKALEDFEIEKDAIGDKVTLVDGLQVVSFTGIEGRFDPAGQTLTIAGNCDWQDGFNFNDAADTLNGSDWQIGGNFTSVAIDLAANSSAGWDLDVVGTAVASGTGDVADCTAGDTEIDASAGLWTDSGGNTNWNFGVVAGFARAKVYGSLAHGRTGLVA